ncbi:MAG: DUF3108 domain-containing protein [Gammaproteobacteria bacterium]|nr:DUF3108 domain-containing protein [Gammaproteobacteria bacterium]
MPTSRDRLPAIALALAATLAFATGAPVGSAAQQPGTASTPAPASVPAAVAVDGAATNGVLQPFRAEFVLEWKGINAASASLELSRESPGRYTYVSRNNARGMFRAVFPDELAQISRLQLEGGRVRPLSYRGDDGSRDTRRDVSLDFDWERRRVTGTAERRPVDLELQPGLQDIMSVQVALIAELQQGRRPSGYTLVDKDRIKDYVYESEGSARLQTVLGPLDTVIWASHRPDSDRVTRVWYAPSLGHVPVRAERRRGGRVEWSMRLVSLSR